MPCIYDLALALRAGRSLQSCKNCLAKYEIDFKKKTLSPEKFKEQAKQLLLDIAATAMLTSNQIEFIMSEMTQDEL